MANNAKNSPSTAPTPVVAIDPTSPIGMADSNVKNAESTLDPVLGAAPDAVEAKKAARPKHAAVRLIPLVLQTAVAKPYLAPKGVDPAGLMQEFLILQQLQVIGSDAGALTLRVDRTVRVRMGKLWDAVSAILAVAEHTPGDVQAQAMAAQVQKALSNGPRKQKAVKVPLAQPSPRGKAAAKVLATQALEAQQAATHAQETPAGPAAPAAVNGGNSSSGGSAPQH